MNSDKIDFILKKAARKPGGITILTGAGISAESGIPTFRGPEGYWTVGSKVYHPQEMATHDMFQKNPRAVWQWYLYRAGICRKATPNPGHTTLVELEKHFKKRFMLITQNVDNLHLKAGQSADKTYQIHGNIFYVRCASDCNAEILPLPPEIQLIDPTDDITDEQWELLRCSNCGGLLRPHVLWFDEAYNEFHYHLESTLKAARSTSLLIVIGTSGATNLPSQVVHEVYHHGGAIIDINIDSNPFGRLAENASLGAAIQQPSSKALPWLKNRLLLFKDAINDVER